MGPPPLALGMVHEEGLYRRMQAKGMVGAFGVIEEEPVSEFPVEVRQVVEEQGLVVIHELFLESAMEAFGVGVHFRRAGVRPPAGVGLRLRLTRPTNLDPRSSRG